VSGPGLWAGVAVLSAAGAMLRFLVDTGVTLRLGGRLPAGTAFVNLSGALLLGLLTGLAAGRGVSLLLGAALLGSYTTFSTWMFETLALAEDGRTRAALANVALQTAAGAGVAALGWAVGAAL
jgi:fluoride exporter